MNCLRLQPEVPVGEVGLSQIQKRIFILTALAKALRTKANFYFWLKPMPSKPTSG